MALSNELISQFVKVTNDSVEAKTETTVYGTIVEFNGTNYVKLDGSDLLTPISTTANTKPGERVTVMIKNHTATVTGNISSPSARIADVNDIKDAADKITEFEIVLANKVDTEELNVQIGRIDDLVSDNVRIKDSLTANEADIDNLQTNVLNVTERLTAAEAEIEDLKVNSLDAETINSTFATISDLEATNAQDSADAAQDKAESTDERVSVAETLIQQLSDSISMIVTDENGSSLMTQTESGWTFSMAEINTALNDVSNSLDTLQQGVGDTSNTVNVLEQAVADLGVLAEYIKVTTYEGEPCIELGDLESDFKLLITNTRIMFLEGSGVPAYINNQSLYINKAVVKEEMQQGGFVWKVRSNGNMGLMWKGVVE